MWRRKHNLATDDSVQGADSDTRSSSSSLQWMMHGPLNRAEISTEPSTVSSDCRQDISDSVKMGKEPSTDATSITYVNHQPGISLILPTK